MALLLPVDHLCSLKVAPMNVKVLAVQPHNDYTWNTLRALLHEYCHYLDNDRFQLTESFHTEGIFKRESSLFKQLVG